MILLFLVSMIWAFSFGLIKGRLTGVDSTAVAVLRLALATVVFLPFLPRARVRVATALELAAIGAVQFGLMYLVYLRAFAYLQAYEVALLTITTPVFVALMDGAVNRRFEPRHIAAAVLSVAGAAVVVWHGSLSSATVTGIVLVQASNLCFAAGQLRWRRIRRRVPAEIKDAPLFAVVYLGALAISLAWSAFTTPWSAVHLDAAQWTTLVYLGVLASGACFFWWNIGATRVNTGTLAAFNNAKIPLAVACSLLFFGERIDIVRLLAGGTLMALSVAVAERGLGIRGRRSPA